MSANPVKTKLFKDNFKNLKPMFTKFAVENIAPINPKIDAGKFMEAVYHECIINPGLQECDYISILMAAKTSASVGLMVGKTYGHAWLVPYWNSKKRIMEAQFQYGYKGLILLLARNGITICPPNIIYTNDPYKLDEANKKISHERLLGVDRGEILAFYVTYKLANGETGYHLMDMLELNKRKDAAMSKIKEEFKKYSPWETWPEGMFKKTVIKNLANYLPIDPETRKDLELEEVEIQERDVTPISKAPASASQEPWYLNKIVDAESLANTESFQEFDLAEEDSDTSVNIEPEFEEVKEMTAAEIALQAAKDSVRGS